MAFASGLGLAFSDLNQPLRLKEAPRYAIPDQPSLVTP